MSETRPKGILYINIYASITHRYYFKKKRSMEERIRLVRVVLIKKRLRNKTTHR